MIEVGLGASQKQDPFEAGKEAALSARIMIEKNPPVFAFVFSSVEFAKNQLLDGIKSVLGDIGITGCSASMVFSSLGLSNYGVTILLIASKEFIATNSLVTKKQASDTERLGQLVAGNLLQNIKKTRHICLYFADAFLESPSSIIKGMQFKLGGSFPIIGGFASDNLKFTQTYQYSQKEVVSSGITSCLFWGPLNFTANIKHGWLPIGRPRIVTKAQNNIIYEIEGLPAIKIYEYFFGNSAQELKKKYFSALSVRYPLGVYIKEENSYILRNVLSPGPDGSLTVQGDVPQNSEIRLMIASRQTCLEATRESIGEVINFFKNKKIYFCIFFESVWRQKLLGIEIEDQFRIIKNLMGKVPFIGFSTYGEEVPFKAIEFRGKSFLHNDGFLALGFGE